MEYERQLAIHKIPLGRHHVQNMGMKQRVLKGEGEFVGQDAYAQLRKLAALFYEESAGILQHPIWQNAKVYFAELTVEQDPTPEFVRYRFRFVEVFEGYQQGLKPRLTVADSPPVDSPMEKSYVTVSAGDTLFHIAQRQGISLDALFGLNPQIKNPNRISTGEQVRVV